MPALPPLALHIDTAFTPPDLCVTFAPAPAAEPVAAFVQPSSSGNAEVGQAFSMPAAPPLALHIDTAFTPPDLCETFIAAPDAEPAAAFVRASLAGRLAIPSAAARLLPFEIQPELEPLSVPDAAFDPPELCHRWIASAAAEPVCSFIHSARAAELLPPIDPAAPALTASIAAPFVPRVASTRPAPHAEPVMAGVWPRIADTPLDQIGSVLQLRLPEFAATLAPLPELAPCAATVGPAAQPVETLVVASAVTQRLNGPALVVRKPEIAAIALRAPEPATAHPVAGAQPEVLEAFMAAVSAAPIAQTALVRLQPFPIFSTEDRAIAGVEQPHIAARAAEPAPAAALQPITTLRVAAPEPHHVRPAPAIPRPGHIAIEYHTQRLRGAAYSRPEWKASRFEPLAPRFLVRPVLEKLEDLIKPKNAQPALVFRMPEPRKLRSEIMEHALRIAAAVIIVTTIWLTAAAMKSGGRVNIRPADPSFTASNPAVASEPQATTAVPRASSGPLAWVQKSLARRATVQVADDFRQGMKSWNVAAKTGSGWERHPDGYMRTGALALFTPTKTFTDYRLEFFSRIESTSMGWAVRARDENNYHAMKFTVVEAGLRPIIAIVHYNVIEGRASRPAQTPLNVMVHNNQPIQVAVNVRGNRFVTSVDGEEIDTYINDVLPAGGVGFFSDAGERAHLYWTRVTKNDDWLGHVCAFLSGDGTHATAEVRPPAPGSAPAPWSSAGEHWVLAAAWIGLPYGGRRCPRRIRYSTRRRRGAGQDAEKPWPSLLCVFLRVSTPPRQSSNYSRRQKPCNS